MGKIELKVLGLSSSQSQSGSFALVLGEVNGNRKLPIIIGMFEAQAIAVEMQKIVSNRPMTHDLFKSFAQRFNFDIEGIIVSDLKEGVFFAKILCTQDERIVEIDSRPSDAIAVGIRFNASIYTYENILSEAGIVLTDEEGSEKTQENDDLNLQDMPSDKLNQMLTESLKKEHYEKAAKIRDELNRRS